MKFLHFLLLLPLCFHSIAQNGKLFESIEYKNAYENDTRSRNGTPGPGYWQNSSDYIVKATFDPETKKIIGNVNVTYHNNSPDSLDRLVFKLMHNVYKKGANRQIATDEKNLHAGVIVKNFSVNGLSISGKSIFTNGTVISIQIPEPILKNTQTTISLDFETPLPKASGYRCGTIDSTSLFAAYWFPQLAVYDDIFGWDWEEYVGIPENYSDFSNYWVEITIPSEYNIWATGEHLNKDEIFSKEILKKIVASKLSSKPITILDEIDFRKPDGTSNTWKFKALNVPDFAWGASDHYVWEGLTANNPDAENKCWVQSAYPPGAKNFNQVIDIAQNSVEILSNHFPGLPYPYFKHITFRGTKGGGMEFPMIANNYEHADTTTTIMVTAHEIAHNYFPFMIGINERKYGWWDETLTTLMESYVILKKYPHHKVPGFFNRKLSMSYYAPQSYSLPLITETSNIMKEMGARINNYIKGPAAMDILVNIIGSEKYYLYNREFMETWAYKHPSPYDFFYYINEKEKESLNWFWNRWFFSYGYPDIAITSAEQNERYLSADLENIGGLPVNFKLNVLYKDGSEDEEEFNASIWKQNLDKISVRIPVSRDVEMISLDKNYSYDADGRNNSILLKE